MAIYLMGHGLVSVPRRLYRNANISGRLRRIQSHASKVNDRLTDATSELEELEAQLAQLRKRKNAVSRDHEEWIEDISDVSSIPASRVTTTAAPVSTPALPAVITDRYLAELSRKLFRARHKRTRFVHAWDRIVQDAVDAQAIIDASATKQLEFGKASPHASWLERRNFLTPYTRYILHSMIIPGARLALAAVFSFASTCIIWSELVKYVAPKLSITNLTVLSYNKEKVPQVGFGGQVMSSIWLLYMSTVTLSSFDDVKIWGNRALVRRNTYGESATWYSGQIAKLTVPLAYNFMTFFPADVHRQSTFYHFLGRLINLTPLGAGFDYFFPIFILVPVCATLFNLYGRAKRVFGFGLLEDDDESQPSNSGAGGWREGRNLIDRELHGAGRLELSSTGNGPSSPIPSGIQSPGRGADRRDGSSTGPNSRPSVPKQSTYAQQQAQRLSDATAAAEDEDESFFQGFAHRVKNTINSVERPEWLGDLPKRPKWMRGVNGNAESSSRAESGRGLGRWFGGRPADGRVRL